MQRGRRGLFWGVVGCRDVMGAAAASMVNLGCWLLAWLLPCLIALVARICNDRT